VVDVSWFSTNSLSAVLLASHSSTGAVLLLTDRPRLALLLAALVDGVADTKLLDGLYVAFADRAAGTGAGATAAGTRGKALAWGCDDEAAGAPAVRDRRIPLLNGRPNVLLTKAHLPAAGCGVHSAVSAILERPKESPMGNNEGH